MAVERHAGFQPQRIAGAQAGGHGAQRLAQFHQHFPHALGDAGAEAQLEAVLAGVAGAADDAPLALGGRVEDADLGAAIVSHRLEIGVHERLQQFHRSRPLDGEHGPKAAHIVPDNLLAGAVGPLFGQMGADPIDDFGPVAGIDDHEEERLAMTVVVVADQHVVQDSARVIGHQRIADLAQFHVGHAAGQELGQKDGRPGPLEAEPAHVGDVGDTHGRTRRQVFGDDRGVLHGQGPAGEIDHPAAMRNMPVIQGGSQEPCIHGQPFRVPTRRGC